MSLLKRYWKAGFIVYSDRTPQYKELERLLDSKVLVYVTGDRKQLETRIATEVLDFFIHHLDIIGDVQKITLFLYTRGGDTLASWSIANLIRQFCSEFEVIVPFRAHSGGTLICLGADKIIMTKQATLGPIDPSVNTPLNPQIPGAPPHARVPVSVEAITGFLEFAKKEIGDETRFQDVLLQLAKEVHPLVLGNAYRARTQIQMLAKKLLARQIRDEDVIGRILKFLCSESGSHDYTINRREAREDLGLNIDKPDDELYKIVKSIYDDIAKELELTVPYDPNLYLGTSTTQRYSFRRALIESIDGGCHAYITEGVLTKQTFQIQPGAIQEAISDQRMFEGWRHEDAAKRT